MNNQKSKNQKERSKSPSAKQQQSVKKSDNFKKIQKDKNKPQNKNITTSTPSNKKTEQKKENKPQQPQQKLTKKELKLQRKDRGEKDRKFQQIRQEKAEIEKKQEKKQEQKENKQQGQDNNNNTSKKATVNGKQNNKKKVIQQKKQKQQQQEGENKIQQLKTIQHQHSERKTEQTQQIEKELRNDIIIENEDGTIQLSKGQKKKLKKQQKIDDNKPYYPPINIMKDAEALYNKETAKALKNYKVSKKDEQWMKKLMTTGTMRDRISAIQVYVKENPKYTLPSLDNLITICGDKNKKEALSAFNGLKDLFLNVLLGEKKLNMFLKNVQEMRGEHTDEDLIDFYYEHKLKDSYLRYIQACVKALSDNQSFVKKAVMAILFELIGRKQENAEFILGSLVNKFGDNDKILVTNLNRALSNLLYKHNELIWTTLKEIQRFVYRKNISITSQFYAINFLNTLNISKLEPEYLKELVNFLFKLFTKILENDSEELYSSKLLAQILRGINKIFPLTKANFSEYKDFYSKKIDELFRLVNVATNFKIRVQTLLFIFQVQSHNNDLSDRYYRVLYELMQSPDMSGTTLHELFFDILYFSLKTDFDMSRVQAFLKRLLQTAIHNDSAFTITSLIFIQKILKVHPSLKSMFSHSEKFYNDEDDEENFKDQESEQEEEQELAQKNTKKNNKQQKQNKKKQSQEIEEEENNNDNQNNDNKEQNKNLYDPFKREPLFSNAQNTALWELNILTKHVHPTVSKFSKDLLNGEEIIYKSNPLVDFTLANFLDRFSFKKNRKRETKGIQQLKAKGKLRMSKLEEELTVSNVLSKIRSDTMREDEKYFIKYFEEKHKKNVDIEKSGKKKVKKTKEEEEEEVDEFVNDLFEERLEDGDIDDDGEFDDEELSGSYDSDELYGQNFNDEEFEDEDGEEGEDQEQGDWEDDEGEEIDNEDEEEDDDKQAKYQEYEDEFEEGVDFDDAEEDDIEDEDDDDDSGDFGDLLNNAGYNEVEEIQKFQQSKKDNQKQNLKEARNSKKQMSAGDKKKKRWDKSSAGMAKRSKKISKRGSNKIRR